MNYTRLKCNETHSIFINYLLIPLLLFWVVLVPSILLYKLIKNRNNL